MTLYAPAPVYQGDGDTLSFELPANMQQAVASALMHELVAGFGPAGESFGRSLRALLAETAYGFLKVHGEEFEAAQRACQANPVEFALLARDCQPENLSGQDLKELKEYLLARCVTSVQYRQFRYTCINTMKGLLRGHGWPTPADCDP